MSKFPYPTRSVIETTDLSTDIDVFPILPGQDFLQAKSPQWSTGIKIAASGREIRTGYWSAPIYNFNVRHNVLRDRVNMVEAKRLVAFFNSCLGSLGIFYYWDQEDYTVAGDQFGTGDGSTTKFQLGRIMAKGTANACLEPIYALWKDPVIQIAGSTASGYALNDTAQVTFATPPANGAALTWTGSFLYLCRFDQDQLDLDEIVALLWENQGLKFRTVKP